MGCAPSKASKVRDPAPVIKSKSNPLSVIDEESENEELEQELLALVETSSASSISDSHLLTDDDDDDDISLSEFVDDDNTSTKEDTGTGVNGENEQRKESPKHVKHTDGKKKSKADEKTSKIAKKQVRFTLPNEELNNGGWTTYEGVSNSGGDWKIKSRTGLQPKRQTYITSDDPSEFIANYPEALHERQKYWYNNGCYFDLDRDIQGYNLNNLNNILYMFRDENTESPCSIM